MPRRGMVSAVPASAAAIAAASVSSGPAASSASSSSSSASSSSSSPAAAFRSGDARQSDPTLFGYNSPSVVPILSAHEQEIEDLKEEIGYPHSQAGPFQAMGMHPSLVSPNGGKTASSLNALFMTRPNTSARPMPVDEDVAMMYMNEAPQEQQDLSLPTHRRQVSFVGKHEGFVLFSPSRMDRESSDSHSRKAARFARARTMHDDSDSSDDDAADDDSSSSSGSSNDSGDGHHDTRNHARHDDIFLSHSSSSFDAPITDLDFDLEMPRTYDPILIPPLQPPADAGQLPGVDFSVLSLHSSDVQQGDGDGDVHMSLYDAYGHRSDMPTRLLMLSQKQRQPQSQPHVQPPASPAPSADGDMPMADVKSEAKGGKAKKASKPKSKQKKTKSKADKPKKPRKYKTKKRKDGASKVTRVVTLPPKLGTAQPETPEDETIVDVGTYSRAERRRKIKAYRCKRDRRATDRIVYMERKRFADARPRIGGRFVKMTPENLQKWRVEQQALHDRKYNEAMAALKASGGHPGANPNPGATVGKPAFFNNGKSLATKAAASASTSAKLASSAAPVYSNPPRNRHSGNTFRPFQPRSNPHANKRQPLSNASNRKNKKKRERSKDSSAAGRKRFCSSQAAPPAPKSSALPKRA